MRVGIVTFHCSYNFGSALQAYALLRLVESRVGEAQVIDYRGRDYYKYYRLFRIARPETMVDNLLGLRGNIKRKDAFERFIGERLNLTSSSYNFRDEERMTELADEFDCFICGSDQIWNLDCTRGPVGPYFLSFAGCKRRIAYAPSLAHTSFSPKNFTEADRRYIGEQLDKFTAVSVREASTVSLFQPLTNKTIDVCLDPTLLVNVEEYRTIAVRAPVEGSFVFAYMLEENPVVMKQAERVARLLGVRLVYVSPRNRRLGVPSTNLYGIGPSEFLDLIARAACVVTNSFHATVFSLLMETPFQTVTTGASGSRMCDLLSSLGEEGHLIERPVDDLPATASPMSFMPKLEELRAHSLAFLDRALVE